MSPVDHPSKTVIIADRVSWVRPDNIDVLRDVSISVGVERVGLVGANGSGKTTLARILAGVESCHAGNVQRSGRIGYLPQDSSEVRAEDVADALGVGHTLAALRRIEEGSDAAEDLHLADDAWDLPRRIEACLADLGLGHLSLMVAVASLSGGELTRVVLGGLLLQRPDFLILDEPTNNLDAQARESLYRVIDQWKGGVLVISHDRTLLRLMQRIVEMTPTGVRQYGGNYELYVKRRDAEQSAARQAVEEARRQRQRASQEMQRSREKKDRRDKVGRKARRSGSHPKTYYDARKGKAETTSSKLGKTAARKIRSTDDKFEQARQRLDEQRLIDIDLTPVSLPAGKTVLEVDHVSFSYDRDRPLLVDVDLRLVGPHRVAITGSNGSGKTTLVRLLIGELTPETGSVRIGVRRVALLDQQLGMLRPEHTVLKNFRRLNPAISETACRLTLARFLFRHEDVHQMASTLSGGERLRAALACVLCATEPPELLILDEPTNHLDLNSLENVEMALRAYDGALVVVSHDAVFLERVGVDEMLELPRMLDH